MIKNTYLLFLLLLFGITGVMAQTVQIENVVKAPGDITVPVDMLGFTATNGLVQSIQFEISFDDALLSFQGLANVNSNFQGWTVPSNGSSSPITISYINMTGHDINTKLFDLKFSYAGGFTGNLNFVTAGCEVSGKGTLTAMTNVTYLNGTVTQVAPVANVDLGGTQYASNYSQVLVPVDMNGLSSTNIVGFTYKIGYDPTKLTFQTQTNSVLSGTLVASAANGVITVTWNGAPTTITNPHVFDLRFQYLGGGSTPVTFKSGSQIVNPSLGLVAAAYTDGSVTTASGGSSLSMLPALTVDLNSPTFSVPVTLNFVDHLLSKVGAVNLTISYDNSILAYQGFVTGTLGAGVVASNLNGVLTLTWDKMNNAVDVNGVLLNLRFKCIVPGTSALKFLGGTTVTQTNLSNVVLSYLNGSVLSEWLITPPTATVLVGANQTFTVSTPGASTFQWQVSTNGGSIWSPLANVSPYSGVSTNVLSLTGVLATMDGYKFRCVNLTSNITSDVATLNVLIIITVNPVSQTVNIGANTSFSITAPGATGYQWQVSTNGGGTWSSLSNGGVYSNVTASTMNITGALASMNAYQYRCVAQPGSVNSTAATLTVNPPTLNLKVFLEGLYNGAGTMRQAYDEFGPHWVAGIADKITVELHNTGTYGTISFTASAVNLSTTGNATITLPLSSSGNSYYITVKHRNSIETVTKLPVLIAGSSVSYDFSSAANKAYGDNLLSVSGGFFAIFGGDVNQDGSVDGSDMGLVENDSNNFVSGYVATDANGDGNVESSDMGIVENNSNNFIQKVTPP